MAPHLPRKHLQFKEKTGPSSWEARRRQFHAIEGLPRPAALPPWARADPAPPVRVPVSGPPGRRVLSPPCVRTLDVEEDRTMTLRTTLLALTLSAGGLSS